MSGPPRRPAPSVPDGRNKLGEAGHCKKKFVVKVKQGDTERSIKYGNANMEIKSDNPERRENFRARHGCDTEAAKNKMTAKYWSCRNW